MPPDDRRAALVEATLPLLREHGRAVTTRQIAEAAGVAEGTIFRVFDSKDDLIDAAVERAFTPGRLLGDVAAIDHGLPLAERMVAFVSLLQGRFLEIFGLMRAIGLVAPPEHVDDVAERDHWRHRLTKELVALIGDDADRLLVPPDELVHLLRLLTFSASHAEISDNRMLTPEQIVDVVLHGVLAADDAKGTR